jgi:undecaprenyl diphosphate synthase
MVLTKENNKLEHLAIIMDGNGRWAARRGLPRSMGHRKGAEVVKEITRAAGELGIKYLTLYAFSTENWNRSEDEVKTLMGLLRDYLQSDLKEVQQNNVRIRFIGEREMLDADIARKMAEIEADTLRNTGMTLCIALSYGSRQEIVNAVKKTAALVKEGDISLNDVDVKLFSDMLYTKDMPDPDLVIRTSGEQRISNYLLWQIAYAEFFFTDVLWPDFNKKLLEDIIKNFNMRERRYGKA